MKIQGKFFMILLGGLMISSVSLMAHEGHEHEENEVKDSKAAMSPAAIWQDIKSKEQKLSETIEQGKLEEVHEIAFAIRDTAKMFLEESKGKPGVPVGLLMSQVSQIAPIAERLDEYGDANNKAKTKEQFSMLKNLLNAIEAQYPKGILNDKQ